MAREEIDIKSIKKLNNSGKPKKASTVNKKFAKSQAGKPGSNRSKTDQSKAGGAGKNSRYGKSDTRKSDARKSDTRMPDVRKSDTRKSDTRKPDIRKSDSNKVDNKKIAPKKKTVQVPEEWLYMNATSASIEVMKKGCEELGYNVEYWPELGILEIGVDETTSMDCEILDSYEDDEATVEYMKNNEIKLALVVTAHADKYGKLKEILENIAEKTEGFFCVDDGKFEQVR